MASWKKLLTTGGVAASDIASGTISDARLPSDCGANTTYNNYTHPTSAGNKHIPAGGSAGQFLKYDSDGTAVWATPSYTTNTNTTYQFMAVSGNSGDLRLRLDPSAGSNDDVDIVAGNNCSFDWDSGNEEYTLNCTNTTYSNSSWTITSLSGFNSSTSNFLRGDGTWATPPDNNTTYSAGAGIDISASYEISLESDSRGDLFQIGRDTNDYYIVNTTDHSWYLDGVLDMKLENDGDLHCDGDVIAYSGTTASDKRLKSDIAPLEYNLKDVLKLEPVKFDWLVRDKGEDIGFIAQDVQKIIPEVVKEVNTIGKTKEFLNDDTMLTVDYSKLVPVLVGAIQELSERIEYLEAKV